MDRLDIGGVQNFLKKALVASQTGSKEVRLSAKEMTETAISIGSIITIMEALQIENEDFKVQIDQVRLLGNSVDTNLDGGGFNE